MGRVQGSIKLIRPPSADRFVRVAWSKLYRSEWSRLAYK
jgi:hypothetical protein